MDPDSESTDLLIYNGDNINLDEKTKIRLGEIELVEISRADLYINPGHDENPLRRIFESMKNVEIIVLRKITGEVLYSFFEDLQPIFAKIKSLRIFGWKVTFELSFYFSSATELILHDVEPQQLNGFKDIKVLIIFLAERSESLSLSNKLDYVERIQSYKNSLTDLHILVTDNERFKYFAANVVNVWTPSNSPASVNIKLRWGIQSEIMTLYLSDNHNTVHTKLEIVTKTRDFKIMTNGLEFTGLRLPIKTKEDLGSLREIIKDKADLNQLILNTESAPTLTPVIMVDFFSVIEAMTIFTLFESDTSVKVWKDFTDSSRRELTMKIHNGEYYPEIMQNAQIIAVLLGITEDNKLQLYSNRLIQLPDVIELKLDDENYKLLALTLARIDKIRKEITEYNPWSRLKKLSAFIRTEDELVIMPVIKRKVLTTLETIELTVENNVDTVERWLKANGWTIVTVEGNKVSARYDSV